MKPSASSPEAQGMDSANLALVFDEIEHGKCVHTHGIYAVRNGKTVVESYFYPYRKDTLHNVNSVTKSLTSALIGIALKQGLLQSVQQAAIDFFPEIKDRVTDPRKRAVTIEHLITMTGGFQFDDDETMAHCMATEDWAAFLFDLPLAEEPGAVFCYNSLSSHVLMMILDRVIGSVTTREFAELHLLGPLGIADYAWMTDPKGILIGGFGARLKPADMAKFGLLYLNKGRWEGRRIVTEEWVEQSTKKRTDNGYGYHWWVHEEEGRYAAAGYGGQYVHVLPKHHLVVAVTNGGDGELPASFFARAIASEDAPLPANEEAAERLLARAREAERPKAERRPLPALAQQLSGRRLRLAPNSSGIEWIELDFGGGREDEAVLVLGEGEGEGEGGEANRYTIGLDNVFRASGAVLNLDLPSNRERGFHHYLTLLQQYSETHTVLHRGFWQDETTFVIHNELIEVGFRQHIVLHFGSDPVQVDIGIPSYDFVYQVEGRWQEEEQA